MNADGALTAKELAAELGMHVTTIRAKAKTGEIPAVRIGRSWRFYLADVKAPKPAPDVWAQPARARRGRAA